MPFRGIVPLDPPPSDFAHQLSSLARRRGFPHCRRELRHTLCATHSSRSSSKREHRRATSWRRSATPTQRPRCGSTRTCSGAIGPASERRSMNSSIAVSRQCRPATFRRFLAGTQTRRSPGKALLLGQSSGQKAKIDALHRKRTYQARAKNPDLQGPFGMGAAGFEPATSRV